MSQPTTVNIVLTRGDDYSAVVTFDQLVSGFSAMRFTMRAAYATTETDNDDATFTTLLTATGDYTALLEIPNADSVGFTADEYVHDIQVTTTTGKKYTTQRGAVKMAPDVTR